MQAQRTNTNTIHYVVLELSDGEVKELERTCYLIPDEDAGLIRNLVDYVVQACSVKP
jgi:hypothetical protein